MVYPWFFTCVISAIGLKYIFRATLSFNNWCTMVEVYKNWSTRSVRVTIPVDGKGMVYGSICLATLGSVDWRIMNVRTHKKTDWCIDRASARINMWWKKINKLCVGKDSGTWSTEGYRVPFKSSWEQKLNSTDALLNHTHALTWHLWPWAMLVDNTEWDINKPICFLPRLYLWFDQKNRS